MTFKLLGILSQISLQRSHSLPGNYVMAPIIGLSGILLAIAFFFLILRCFGGSSNGGLPINWPLIGMLPQLLLQVHRCHDWTTEILEGSGCTFMFKGPWFAHMEWLFTVDPSNIHYIMSSNFSNFPKGSEFREMFDILGDGIFNSDFDMWKSQRKLTRDLFNHRLFYKLLVNVCQNKVEKGLLPVLEHVSEQGLVVDLQDLMQRFTFDATCLIVTGHDPGCLTISFPDVAFSKALDDAEEAIFYRHVLPGCIWKLQRLMTVGHEKRLRKAWETLDQISSVIISSKKEEIAKRMESREEGEGMDFLTSLYLMEDGVTGTKLPDRFMRDAVINLMLAGRDTTSAALSWFFWLVSKNPHVETKIREELQATLPAGQRVGQEWRLFDLEVLKRLAYLHGALCESMRLYPPVPFQHKAPLRPDILPSGHHVNPNMKIMFSLYAMGRMTAVWGNDCMEFKPERWITERGGIKHEPSYKFLAFNAGPRTCLGKETAFIQMKAVAAAIIYNYNIQVLGGQSVTPSLSVILHMKHGMKVKLFKRWA